MAAGSPWQQPTLRRRSHNQRGGRLLLYVLDLVGVAVFAVSGALAARYKQMDLLGVFVLALATGVGGGTLRDLLVGRGFVFWVEDPTYLGIVALATAVTVLAARRDRIPLRSLQVADAFGLGLFAISGAQVAEAQGLSPAVVIMMGAVTGTAGGLVRDILRAEVPLVLRREIYATAALLGVALYLALHGMGIPRDAAAVIGAAAVIAIRLTAMARGLHLPGFPDPDATPE